MKRIVAASAQMREVLAAARRFAGSDVTVLVMGETGTGKEVVARTIHYASGRRGHEMLCVNCAALQENLLESELFGHEKGAFTGAYAQHIGRLERAYGGTVLLDEVGDMSLTIQAKMLRAVEEREFERLGGSRTIRADVRLLCATNRDLPAMVERGEFRKDLFYRLNVVSIEIPPLRERRADILPLAQHYLAELTEERSFSQLAKQALLGYDWPGNIRELENSIERAILISDGLTIEAEDLFGSSCSVERPADIGLLLDQGLTLKEIERLLVIDALERTDWSQKEAAALLGVSKRSMNYKVQCFGLVNPKWRRNTTLSPADNTQ